MSATTPTQPTGDPGATPAYAPPVSVSPRPEPMHPCVRCGRPVPMGVAMCEFCNPLGLADPAASQAHGTVFLAIGAAVVALALIGRFALAGIGPFAATVDGVVKATDATGAVTGLTITLTVKNEGTKTGASTCRVHDPALVSTDRSAIFLSPEIAAGASQTFTRTTNQLGLEPSPTLQAECS